MISRESAKIHYRALQEIIESEHSPAEGIILARAAMKNIYSEAVSLSKQFFSNFYSRAIYLFDQYDFPGEMRDRIIALNYFAKRLAKNKLLFCSEKDFLATAWLVARSLEILSEESPPEDIRRCCGDHSQISFTFEKEGYTSDIADLRMAVVAEPGEFRKDKKYAELFLRTNEGIEATLRLYGGWIGLWRMCRTGSALNIFSAKVSAARDNTYSTGPDTLIVLEPDYLIDVTDIAGCFGNKGGNLAHYVLKKFMSGKIGAKLVLGNLVNHFFDELIEDPDAQFDQLHERSLMSRPLQIFALALADPDGSRRLIHETADHYQRLREIVPELGGDRISVEPSFISPDYGLQGRLDAMIEYDSEPDRKNIIELKSGRAPSTSLYVSGDDGKAVPTGIWSNHLAQTTCYNLLLDSTFRSRSGVSQILYSSTSDYPLRNAPNIMRFKREVLMFRNACVAADHALMRGKYKALEMVHPEKSGDMPTYLKTDVIDFANVYAALIKIEREYFHAFISFIQGELFFEKTGEGGEKRGGFSALWRDSAREKKLSKAVYSDLELMEGESDFEKGYLLFVRRDGHREAKTVRRGDLAVLYPVNAEGNSLLLERQVVKCTVKVIEGDTILISLRNKMSRRDFFGEFEKWNIEPDHIDSGIKAMFRSLYSLMSAGELKRRVILGLEPPRFGSAEVPDRPELNDIQNNLLKKAVNARDYFLVQGPPGTGKTSYMLRAIVDHIYNNTDENLLLMAYTNRACDEICAALKTIEPKLPFLRAGSKESSEHKDRLISELSESKGLRELFLEVKNTRIFVSTVSTALTNTELMQLKHFHTAVIDEASQILEPQIAGIIARTDRFIMIGDERQLPAIVTQPPEFCRVESDNLLSIGLEKTSGSLFERLANAATRKGWPEAKGMLRRQARMHEDIQALANELFYGGYLTTFPEIARQHARTDTVAMSALPTAKIFENNRITFIESEAEYGSKYHRAEARRTAQIVRMIREIHGDDFSEESVGVIAPFRAQCSEIRSMLGAELERYVAVDTVERFQGSQRDIIIISFAVNYPGQLDMISNGCLVDGRTIDRKLNVAVTRSRERLIILGRGDVLGAGGSYAQLLEYIATRGAIISAEEFDSAFALDNLQ
jgi:DNA replication ATP-dependent helicase Dna2